MHQSDIRQSVTRHSVTRQSVLILSLLLLLQPLPSFATCGGGGGGGVGGASPSIGGSPVVYAVPWEVVSPGEGPANGTEGLNLFWFPVSPETARTSEMQRSRVLSTYANQCVHPVLVTPNHTELRETHRAGATAVAVLVGADGTEIGRVEAEKESVNTLRVEELVHGQVERVAKGARDDLGRAKDAAKSGDESAAVDLYSGVWSQRCLIPKEGKKAAKALKKLGHPVSEKISAVDPPNLSGPLNNAVTDLMRAGVEAEIRRDFEAARIAYEQANQLDPVDPVPLRYLAEFHRHHSGNWELATTLFEEVLAGRPDAISKAVALHGLGKMTIHAGDFGKGLALFEQSIATYPLPLTYRNMAVYWNSENEAEKAYGYVQAAMELAPTDAYNQVFAATYLVELGRSNEALEMARKHEGLIEASYNLAAIHAQLGDRSEALRLLSRHFYTYETTDAVRAKEMTEARDDIVFESLKSDPEFVALTALADVDSQSYHSTAGSSR